MEDPTILFSDFNVLRRNNKVILNIATSALFASYECAHDGTIVPKLKSTFTLFGGMRVAIRLHPSQLYILVPSGVVPGTSPRKLRIWDSVENKTKFEQSFATTVKLCKWNKKYLAVGLDDSIRVFELKTMTAVVTLETRKGYSTFSLSSDEAQSVLVHIAGDSDPVGHYSVYDCIEREIRATVMAHRTEIDCLTMDCGGNFVATSSMTGTVVRVFALYTGECLHSFRHSTFTTSIKHLNFCPKSEFLLASSTDGAFSLFCVGDNCFAHTTSSNTNNNNSTGGEGSSEKPSASVHSLNDFGPDSQYDSTHSRTQKALLRVSGKEGRESADCDDSLSAQMQKVTGTAMSYGLRGFHALSNTVFQMYDNKKFGEGVITGSIFASKLPHIPNSNIIGSSFESSSQFSVLLVYDHPLSSAPAPVSAAASSSIPASMVAGACDEADTDNNNKNNSSSSSSSTRGPLHQYDRPESLLYLIVLLRSGTLFRYNLSTILEAGQNVATEQEMLAVKESEQSILSP